MESGCKSASQQALWKDVEAGKEKKKNCNYMLVGIIMGLVLLSVALSVFSLRWFWTSSPKKVYDLQYKVVLDGVETDSLMEIDPVNRIEVFRMGNGSDEVLEVHDFKNGITGIRFAKHQRCYIRTQTKELPTPDGLDSEDNEMVEDESKPLPKEALVWIPTEEPIADRTFLRSSKIFEICHHVPIHWIQPVPLRDTDITDDVEESKIKGHRQTRDVLDQLSVNDYSEVGIELDQRLDEMGYCCQHCRQPQRYCQRYHEPLRGFWPYPYYYQGGRVICRAVMPCNWWIARMLGRV